MSSFFVDLINTLVPYRELMLIKHLFFSGANFN